MDQEVLVRAGHTIVRGFDALGMPPRAALWVIDELMARKLWVVPHQSIKGPREFYRIAADIVSRNRSALGGVDAADLEIIPDNHPVILALRQILKMPELGNAEFRNNRFNGYFLTDCLVLRMNF